MCLHWGRLSRKSFAEPIRYVVDQVRPYAHHHVPRVQPTHHAQFHEQRGRAYTEIKSQRIIQSNSSSTNSSKLTRVKVGVHFVRFQMRVFRQADKD